MTVKLTIGGKLPDPDLNGLSPLGATLLADRNRKVLVTAMLSQRTAKEDYESGDWTLTLGIDHIEAVDGVDGSVVARIMKELCSARTGLEHIDGWDQAVSDGEIDVGDKWRGTNDDGDLAA